MSLPSVNKKELASILSTTLPTLSAWIERYADEFPVEERGTNGREWRFDAGRVTAFLQERREAEERAEADRAAFLEQFRLPGLEGSEAASEGAKATDLLAMARLRSLERREALESGLLVPTSDVRTALTAALGKLNRAMNAALQQIGRKHGWPEAMMRDAQAMFHEAQRGFVRDAGSFTPDTTDLFAESPDGEGERLRGP